MKQLVLSAWAWVVAHPEATLAALYALLNAINAAIPVERRKASVWLRVLDRVCIATQRGAINAGSWPLAGRSIAKTVAGAVIAEQQPQADATQPQRPSVMPPSEPGYAEQWVLGAIALAAVVALALSGCSAREQLRRSVEPLGLYEVQHPLHGSCHEVGVRAQSATINRELVVYGGVCVGRIDAGVVGDAGAVE